MPIGSLQFRPGLWPTLAFLITLPGLLALGCWQLERAAEKRALFAAFEAGAAAPALPLAETEPARYRHVLLEGRYESGRQFLLDNMTHAGRAGYHVLTPFRLESGGWILVNRGWLPRAARGLPEVAVAETPRRITGRLDRLPVPGLTLATRQPAAGWPRVVQFPAMEELEAALGHELPEFQLLLDAGLPDAYRRDWRPASFGPERHQAYALQWFALAAALVVIYIVVNTRRT